MRGILIAFIISLCLNDAHGQSPYELNWKTDGPILGASAILGTFDLVANKKLTLLTTQEIYQLDPSNINAFDRKAASLYSEAADLRSDLLMYAGIGLGFVPSLEMARQNDVREGSYKDVMIVFTLWLETFVITEIGTDLTKSTVKRTRPYAYNSDFPIEQKYGYNTRKSFFSGHTSMTAANTFFFAKVFSDYYPESKWKPMVWSAAALIPAWAGFERVLAGKHFPTDVMTGYIFGAACGYLIPHLHKVKNTEQARNIQAIPFNNNFGSGVSLTMTF